MPSTPSVERTRTRQYSRARTVRVEKVTGVSSGTLAMQTETDSMRATAGPVRCVARKSRKGAVASTPARVHGPGPGTQLHARRGAVPFVATRLQHPHGQPRAASRGAPLQ